MERVLRESMRLTTWPAPTTSNAKVSAAGPAAVAPQVPLPDEQRHAPPALLPADRRAVVEVLDDLGVGDDPGEWLEVVPGEGAQEEPLGAHDRDEFRHRAIANGVGFTVSSQAPS
jgi:hypothetical protein